MQLGQGVSVLSTVGRGLPEGQTDISDDEIRSRGAPGERYGLRGVRVGEASQPGLPGQLVRRAIRFIEEVLDDLEAGLTRIDSSGSGTFGATFEWQERHANEVCGKRFTGRRPPSASEGGSSRRKRGRIHSCVRGRQHSYPQSLREMFWDHD